MNRLRPRKMQTGGQPRQSDYPDYESWQAAMDAWLQSLSPAPPERIETGELQRPVEPPEDDKPDGEVVETSTILPGRRNTRDPIDQQYDTDPAFRQKYDDSLKKKTYTKTYTKTNKVDPYFILQGATTGLEWLSGMVERNRQNQYMTNQFSTLGQIGAKPVSNYQPNAINPGSAYAQIGGYKGGGWMNKPKEDISEAFLLMMKRNHGSK